MIALTATATTETRLQIVKTLEMKNPALIVDISNRQNIAYGVKVITPNPSVTFAKMVSDLKVQKTSYERTIIYCPTIKLTTHLYGFFQAELSEHIYADESQDPKKRIVEMFHSRSDELNKEEILKFGDSNGCIRVLIAPLPMGWVLIARMSKLCIIMALHIIVRHTYRKVVELDGKVRTSANQ